ncbi:SMC-Scp complex subunit ScpB [Acidicapsa acidisoli]|uniref:SMC-Scp complex subunit ScpB n=1 Tax=Acidicapsa acidisoli TaxID=1615681 RepID=UPI0021DFBC67|nr:SMC-Scp complex subunit ScpB [Acidicapsa acidisoli]
MSLKAKLEAVIYAAEEPVTLAQLAVLFAEDAFAWKAERDAENLKLATSVESAVEQAGEPGPSDSTLELADLVEVVEAEPQSESVEQEVETEPAASEVPEFEVPEPESDSLPLPEAETSEQPTPAEPESMVAEAAEPEVSESESDSLPAPEPEMSEQTAPSEPEPETTVAEITDPALEARRLERKRDREVREILRSILDELIAEYAQDSRGLEIREIAGGFRMGTKPEIHDAVRAFVKSLKPPMKLSLPALETLAVIAYKQPVTAPEVGEIRGVDSAGVLGSLMSRKLIATAGRKQVIGRPMQYKTTKEFLLRFGLKDLNELPSMEEFEKMAAMELSEESMEEEPMDEEQAEPVEQSGELFTEADSTGGDLSKSNDAPSSTDNTGGDLTKPNVAATSNDTTGGDFTKSNELQAHRTSGDLSKSN